MKARQWMKTEVMGVVMGVAEDFCQWNARSARN